MRPKQPAKPAREARLPVAGRLRAAARSSGLGGALRRGFVLVRIERRAVVSAAVAAVAAVVCAAVVVATVAGVVAVAVLGLGLGAGLRDRGLVLLVAGPFVFFLAALARV